MQSNPTSINTIPAFEQFFPAQAFSLWQEAAQASLRGADFEKQLYTQTLEGLTLQPLYTAQNLPENLALEPGQADQRRGPMQPGWLISQDWYVGQSQNEEIEQQLKHGLESLEINLSATPAQALPEEILTARELSLFLETSPTQQVALQAQLNQPARKAPWGVLVDPVSLWLQGQIESVTYESIATTMQADPLSFALQVSGIPFHEAGAHAAQELAYTMGSLVEGIQALLQAGLSINQILAQTRLVLGVGPRFFMEVAKIRASRILVARIAEIYQSTNQPWLHARTSRLWLTHYDPYTNYLRQTIGACAAVIGNVDSLTVGGFSEAQGIPDAFAQRQARNLQLLLKHEVHLDRLLDPAGGSYFIESLTTQLAEAAWSLFQETEAQGGLLKALAQGHPQAAVATIAQQRLKQVEQRRQILVGTTTYANPTEKWQAIHTQANWPAQPAPPAQGLSPLRLAEGYENLRQTQEQAPKTVTLLCLGHRSDYLARSEFARGFFEAAGCQLESSPALIDQAALQTYLQDKQSDVWVLCSSDAAYQHDLDNWVAAVKSASAAPLVLAGRTPNETSSEGLTASIYLGCNALKTLEQILNA